MTDETKEDVKKIFKTDMQTQERIESVISETDPRELAETSLDVAEEVIEEIDNPDREKYTWTTVLQIGKVTGSDQLAEYAAKKLKQWGEEHGNA